MKKFILITILLIAFFARSYRVGSYPPLLWDEAALGYNAYSIVSTGRDEHGQLLPLIFKSFGDFKPGLYIYLDTLFVRIFGLNEFSTRLPSVLAGTLSVLFLYLLVNKLSGDKTLSLLSAFILATQPYSVHFSRQAWEANILVFEVVAAIYLFLTENFLWSSILFSASLYTYQSAKIITPLVVIFLFFFKNQKINKKLIMFLSVLLISTLPVVYGLMFKDDSSRLKVLSVFSYKRPDTEVEELINYSSPFLYHLFFNDYRFYVRNIASRYFNHFSPEFLFFKGDWQNFRHSSPYIGVVQLSGLILIPIAFYSVIKKKERSDKIFLLLLLISPIPACLTRDQLGSVRALLLTIPIAYFMAKGLKQLSNILRVPFLLITLISFLYSSDLYFDHMVKINPQSMLFGYKQAIEYIASNNHGQKIFLTDFYNQPYIYYLFYTKYPPKIYQAQKNFIQSGDDTGRVTRIDNIYFEPFNRSYAIDNPGLYVYSQEELYRQGDISGSVKISPVNDMSTFFAYQNE